MTNFADQFHTRFDTLRNEYLVKRNVPDFFRGMRRLRDWLHTDADLAESCASGFIATWDAQIVGEYNLQAARFAGKLAAPFAAAAAKYDFPVKMVYGV